MNKKITIKRIIKIIAITIISILGAIVLFICVCNFIISPIQHHQDEKKFQELDSRMRILYDQIVAASDGRDQWKYLDRCVSASFGPFSNGDYSCSIIIATETKATSTDELVRQYKTYFPIFNNSEFLKSQDVEEPSFSPTIERFGKEFVVSMVAKNFIEKESSVVCNYDTELLQTDAQSFDVLGAPIVGGVGNTRTAIDCGGYSLGLWYPEPTIYD